MISLRLIDMDFARFAVRGRAYPQPSGLDLVLQDVVTPSTESTSVLTDASRSSSRRVLATAIEMVVF
jgi:hypothetical protein